ncbi:thymidine kinase 2, mitochondrial-like [Mya arenaria]|uniref:thymidine kinase 2, mitochondrial-like n=1 Tax=Mya arenaria TaxID=6604 RepID=UPI0022E7857C|nr:thymidine kinase 2, mitochondrial-like [Mya arenaria]
MLSVKGLSLENVQPTPKRQPRAKKPFTVAVEGNIGSGKSTCLEYFHKQKEVEVVPEPVFKWKDVKGYNTLELMYKDASRWSLAFQSYVQLTMAEVHRKETTCPVKMIERSLYSARYCFVENLYKGGLMPEIDYAILSEWYDWIQENEDMHIDLIVYLQASSPTCQSRIKKRNRHEEQAVPIEYLDSLNSLHEDWLIKQSKFKTPCPVLIINTDCGMDDMYRKFELHRDEILQINKEN